MEIRDPLADVLDLLRVRGAVMAQVRAHAPWGLRLARSSGATFHAVTAGGCWVRLPGQPPRELLAGDVVLLPTGAAHVVASEAKGPAEPWDRAAKLRARNEAGEILVDGPGRSTHLLCAGYDYDRKVAHPLLSLLPPLLFVSAAERPSGGAVASTLGLLQDELGGRSAGWGATINRLIDVLFVHVIRAWLAHQEGSGTSWLMALRDPVIARALAALHAEPGAPWTIDRLAREVNLSRATLTRRFAGLVGEPPMAYLTRWRIELAARALRETDDPVGSIAHRVGYTSEFAFSRAFSRLRGHPPGRHRAELRGRLTRDPSREDSEPARFVRRAGSRPPAPTRPTSRGGRARPGTRPPEPAPGGSAGPGKPGRPNGSPARSGFRSLSDTGDNARPGRRTPPAKHGARPVGRRPR